MRTIKIIILLSYLFFLIPVTLATTQRPQLFLFLGADTTEAHHNELNNACITGAQIIYTWKQLEPQKGVYDFSKIEKDLHYLKQHHKQLFLQIQDRSFQPYLFNVPDYLREDPLYHGGVAQQFDTPGEGMPVTSGWVARVWDEAVRERFQLLIKQLATQFDGKVAGINLPETAVDFDEKNIPYGFTPASYFKGELDNLAALRLAFHQSLVLQYVNFFPGEWNNDQGYMSQLFAYALKNHIALGGPDTVPYKSTHMKNSYPFFHQNKNHMITGIAIQEPDYTYINPETGQPYTFSQFYTFAQDYLGASLLFWSVQEPFFTHQLKPELHPQRFECPS